MVHIRCNTSEKMCDKIETGPGIVFLDRNRNLYDIYDSYRSIQVARSLFEKNTFISGTIRNRKHISSQLKSKLEVGELTSIIQSITTEWLAEKNVNPESSLGHTSRDSTVPGISKLPGRREKVCVDCSRLDGGPVPTCVVDLSDACRAS
ncbi:hypothetical protein M0804_001289 [Polistes exclamans]|nr:hypothetical protein M0804_001289 [Polistes exclamans]